MTTPNDPRRPARPRPPKPDGVQGQRSAPQDGGRDPRGGAGPSRGPRHDGPPQEYDAFVVDTRRSKGNRRAMPPKKEPQERPRPIPVRGTGAARAGRTGSVPDARREVGPQPGGGHTRIMPAGGRPAGGRQPSDAHRRPAVNADGGLPPRSGSSRPGGPSGPGGPGSDGSAPRPRRRFGRGRKIVAGVLVFAILWIASLLWAGNSAWKHVGRVDAMPSQHLADGGEGRNVLIVGSDARSGLTTEQKRKLGTGNADGQRTDSIMILHTGGGKPTLMSIPRDSYVSIPGHQKNKINASFSLGGPQLLIQTIEQNTGIHVDDYMEIGFGGFASVVDAVGGVNICVKRDMDDPKAHINLKKGCQDMDGPTALGYVRARYSDPEGDLGRAKRQRQFLGALMKKIGSPSNVLVPWKLKGLGESGAQGLTVDDDMSMFTALRTMWTLKKFSGDGGNSVVVPVGDSAMPTRVGEVVSWDPQKSAELFKAIKENGDTAPFVKKAAG